MYGALHLPETMPEEYGHHKGFLVITSDSVGGLTGPWIRSENVSTWLSLLGNGQPLVDGHYSKDFLLPFTLKTHSQSSVLLFVYFPPLIKWKRISMPMNFVWIISCNSFASWGAVMKATKMYPRHGICTKTKPYDSLVYGVISFLVSLFLSPTASWDMAVTHW